MADITKCVDKKCPSHEHCYRWTAPNNPDRQAFADFDRQGGDYCEAYEPDPSKTRKEKD